jgi:archaellum component FlaF (FlaF/FlaG flagellin family)
VLATVLDDGRVEQSAQAGDIIKLLTAEARIRGEGRVVVRRQRGTTLVSAQSGSFRVEGNGKTVTLAAGEGTRVEPGSAPTPPEALLPAPIALEPGDDPRYVLPGETVSVRFNSSAGSHHLQVLGVDSSQVLIERDIAGSPATLAIPWPGTFRWRVAARDAHGLEGLPSREGLIAVVAK